MRHLHLVLVAASLWTGCRAQPAVKPSPPKHVPEAKQPVAETPAEPQGVVVPVSQNTETRLPSGTWTKAGPDDGMVEVEVEFNRIRFTSSLKDTRMTFKGDYRLTGDGAVAGTIHTLHTESPNLSLKIDQFKSFGFAYEHDGDTMTLTDFSGTCLDQDFCGKYQRKGRKLSSPTQHQEP